jgi:glycosyltransferase involved in cell wall biosynthesis
VSPSPRVSVGLPVFNAERFVAATIDSILAQTFEDFELIISDNASTDGTEEICQRYAGDDDRIRYVRNPENLGLAYNYNQTFHLSSGEYFKWAAHDDLLRSKFLERCVEALDRDPSVVMSYTGWAPIDETGNLVTPNEIRYPAWRADSPDPVERSRFTFHMEPRPPSAIYGLFRSDVLRRTRLFRPTHGGDHILIAEVSLYGPFLEVPETLFLNRWHSGSGGKRPTYQERVAIYLPASRAESLGHGPVGAFLLFGKTMAQNATAQVDSIRRAPLSSSDKLRCYAQLPIWLAGQLWRKVELRLPGGPRRGTSSTD